MSTATATAKPATIVLYDGNCPLCQKSVAVLRRLDWLGQLTYYDARADHDRPAGTEAIEHGQLMEEMHVRSPGGQVTRGFKAFRTIAWRLPLLWPIAPFLYLPFVPAIGQRVYLWVAKRRYDLVPCKDGVCRLPDRAAVKK